MKYKCCECKRKIDEEGMLWAKAPLDFSIWGAREICTKCYDKLGKEGIAMVTMPLKGNVLGGKEQMNKDYPTVDKQFLFKWSEKILDNYGMNQDRGIHAPIYELLKQMLEEAWVIVEE